MSVFASANGSSGPTVSVNKALCCQLLLSIDIYSLTDDKAFQAYQSKGTGHVFSFAAADIADVIDLTDVSVGVFTQAIENIATLRADNGGSMSRLSNMPPMMWPCRRPI